MRKVRRTFFGSRWRAVATSLAAFALVATGSAVAAFIIFTGMGGSVGGKIETGTAQAAIVVSADGTVPKLIKGATTAVPIKVTNPDTVPHTAGSVTVTFTTTPTSCKSSLSVVDNGITTASIPGGATVNGSLAVAVANSLPAECSGADWTATYSGSTSP